MKEIRDLDEEIILIEECPLCGKKEFSVIKGPKVLFFKKPDHLVCDSCDFSFYLSEDLQGIKPIEIPQRYDYFRNRLEDWVELKDISFIAKLIHLGDDSALSFIEGADVYLWREKLSLDNLGSAEVVIQNGRAAIAFEYQGPESEDEHAAFKKEIVVVQKELRQIKREIAQDMKEIREKYGRTKANADAKKQALFPYENMKLLVDKALISLDRYKLELSK